MRSFEANQGVIPMLQVTQLDVSGANGVGGNAIAQTFGKVLKIETWKTWGQLRMALS